MAAKQTPPKDENKEVDQGGRPPVWEDPIDLKEKILDYFNSEEGKETPTLAGLAVAIGVSRGTLYNYEKKDGFLDIIKKARERVEKFYEIRLIYSDRPTGVIFALKNMGWYDTQKIDHSTLGQKIEGFNMLPPEEKKKPAKPKIEKPKDDPNDKADKKAV